MKRHYTEDEEHRMDRAEDAYLNMRLGEPGPVHAPPTWQPWAMSTDETHARKWLAAHDEDGRDHDTD